MVRSTRSSCTSITPSPARARWRLRTPVGTIFHTGDFKFDQTPIDGKPADFSRIARIGDEGVLCMLSDSTNAERPGHTLSERMVGEAFSSIFAHAKGRIVVASFASNVPRIQQTADHAVRFKRKLALLGRSLRNVVHFATELGYLRIPPDTLIKIEDVNNYPPEQIVVMTTGSQGEPMSGLSRMSVRDHKLFSIVPGDTVVISATPIPGNEKSVHKTINNLAQTRRGRHSRHRRTVACFGARVARRTAHDAELSEARSFSCRYTASIACSPRTKSLPCARASKPGNVFIVENGDVLEFTNDYGDKVGRTYGGHVFVDGSGIGDIGEAVLRDRKALSNDGIMMVVLAIDSEEARVIAGPDITSKGVFYLPEAGGVLDELRAELVRAIEGISVDAMRDVNSVKEHIRSALASAVHVRTKRRPIVIPVVMEV